MASSLIALAASGLRCFASGKTFLRAWATEQQTSGETRAAAGLWENLRGASGPRLIRAALSQRRPNLLRHCSARAKVLSAIAHFVHRPQ
eukprot:7375759-Alexandrium_andersonii.AAC.1